jgi:hypothetical protein
MRILQYVCTVLPLPTGPATGSSTGSCTTSHRLCLGAPQRVARTRSTHLLRSRHMSAISKPFYSAHLSAGRCATKSTRYSVQGLVLYRETAATAKQQRATRGHQGEHCIGKGIHSSRQV